MSGNEKAHGRRLADALDDYLLAKSKTGNSGNYRRNAERVVNEWIEWTNENRSVYTLAGLDVADLEAYALYLKERSNDPEDLAASSANKYYDYVRAYLGWCEERDYIDSNPARHHRAEDALPDDSRRQDHRQQVWSPEQRQAIVDYVDERARTAVDEKGKDAVAELRDRAFVVTIAYSGVRGGEIVADPNDDRRNGIRWKDIDLENGTLVVLDKGDQEYVDASLPPQAVTALDRYRMALDPPTDEWPVFPTRHRPKLYALARETLSEDGYDEDAIEERLDDADVIDILREYEVPPPAITTDGGRDIMKRLSSDASIPGIDTSDGEYLELHGGRHGAGDTIVRELGYEAAQHLLRHNSPRVTVETYSHIGASEVADEAGEAFEKVDRGTNTGSE